MRLNTPAPGFSKPTTEALTATPVTSADQQFQIQGGN